MTLISAGKSYEKTLTNTSKLLKILVVQVVRVYSGGPGGPGGSREINGSKTIIFTVRKHYMLSRFVNLMFKHIIS